MSRTGICSLAFLISGVLASVSFAATGSRIALLESVTKHPEHGTLTFFHNPGGDERVLIELKRRLSEEGAFHINVFSPEWLACKAPEGLPLEGVAAETGVAVISEEEASSDAWKRTGLERILASYELARSLASSGRSSHGIVTPTGVPIDKVLVVPEASTNPPEGAKGVPSQEERGIQQNSEFLLGDIVVNLVFPESDGGSENWTDAELSDAIKGAYAAMLDYQEKYSYASMNFVFKSFRRVETVYEPIDHNDEDDYLWVSDCMNTLGFGQPHGDAFAEVHAFNEYWRKRYRADWAFAAFIADAGNDPDHLFRGGNYTAYAYLGGPYLVIPYPAGYSNPNRLEEWDLFSHILQHEICHIFWALDEYPSAIGDCQSHSGYLDYYNRNKILDVGVGDIPVGCQELVPCLMASARSRSRPVCGYTAGMVGVIDNDGNSIPDVFDAPPRVEFQNSAIETVTASSFTLRCTALSVAVENKNPFFANKPWKLSYASPLKDGIIDINGAGEIFVTPEDGRWDEEEEEIKFSISGIPTGLTILGVTVRSKVGASSGRYEKRVYNLGLTFSPFEITVLDGAIRLAWSVIGETFGAKFDLFRVEPAGGAIDTVLLATDLPPSGPRVGFHLPFTFLDENVLPGMNYRYFIVGTYVVAGNRTLTYRSPLAAATAMFHIPSGNLVSLAVPNPSRDKVMFSIEVPSTYEESVPQDGSAPLGVEGAPAVKIEVPTAVEAVVYDVGGRIVSRVYSNRVFPQALTVSWDGTDDRGIPVPSGVYFFRVRAGDIVQTRKVILIR